MVPAKSVTGHKSEGGLMQYFTDPSKFTQQRVISLDTEYSEQDIKKANLLSISVGLSPTLAGVFSPKDLRQISPQLLAADIIFTQNGAVDYWILKRHGLELDRTRFIDCMLMEHLIDENISHSLGGMAVRHFNDSYKADFWNKYKSYQESSKEDALEYELRDACYTYTLGATFFEQIKNKQLIAHVHRLYWSLFDTEIEGVRVNLKLMQDTQVSMKAQIDEYLPKLRKEFNDHCNIWEMEKWCEEIEKRSSEKGKQRVNRPVFSFTSDAQIRWLVYEGLKAETTNRTKKGNPSTDYGTLQSFTQKYPELATLVKYKEIKGIYATFVEGLLDKVIDSHIYPKFLVNGTATGRISHANPNLGNLPREGVIRNFFLPTEGRVLIGADYSQLEVIVEANLTNDPSLLKIILEGVSKHDITAQGLGISRDAAKTLNFALQYGAGVHKVSKLLGVSYRDAEDVFKRYWELYSGVRTLKEKTSKEIEEKGQISNLFGRTRHFEKPKNEFEKSRQERQAYNFLVQGVGADLTNKAFYLYAEYTRKVGIGRALWSVHDEILAEVEEGCEEDQKLELTTIMNSLSKPLNFKYGLQSKAYGPMKCWGKG